jgi:hypothetical protein
MKVGLLAAPNDANVAMPAKGDINPALEVYDGKLVVCIMKYNTCLDHVSA